MYEDINNVSKWKYIYKKIIVVCVNNSNKHRIQMKENVNNGKTCKCIKKVNNKQIYTRVLKM